MSILSSNKQYLLVKTIKIVKSIIDFIHGTVAERKLLLWLNKNTNNFIVRLSSTFD